MLGAIFRSPKAQTPSTHVQQLQVDTGQQPLVPTGYLELAGWMSGAADGAATGG